jgi:hypothetical protein
MAEMVKMERLGFRQIFRQAILTSIDMISYLLGIFKEDSVNSLSGRF